MANMQMTSRAIISGIRNSWKCFWCGPVLDRAGEPIPDSQAPRVCDEHLEFLGQMFEDNDCYAYGILFETFIAAPEAILEAIERRRLDHYADDDTFLPLLPAQARVARQIELQTPLGRLTETLENVPTAVMRDGTLIEPLHHTRFPRNHTSRRAAS